MCLYCRTLLLLSWDTGKARDKFSGKVRLGLREGSTLGLQMYLNKIITAVITCRYNVNVHESAQ